MLLVRSMPLTTQQEAQEALQYAMQLELATIPPYLTALYSLKPGTNDAIAALMKGIVFEEMQHMALAANMLNAVGGKPVLNQPNVVPRYPGGLPFHIGDRNGRRFEVPLARFSLDLVETVFMRIEEPDEPLAFPAGTNAAYLAQQQFRTIGDFYQAVRSALQPEWFLGDPARQVRGIVPPIISLQDARAAIDLIVEEGEGTTKSPLAGQGRALAHYYRFAEIVHLRTLVRDTGVPEGYSYSGPPIPFDPTEVCPILENPNSGHYPPGSKQRVASDLFNLSYSNLLRAFHVTFDGRPDNLDTAIGLMFDLKLQALKLMAMTIEGGLKAAPCYEFVA